MEKMIALVAHDHMKKELAQWVSEHAERLAKRRMVCTGTTGRIVEQTLQEQKHMDLDITLLKSGPLGGDQQLGALIAEQRIAALMFFWDPMAAQPHDVDVKALLRLATLYNVPTAINPASAEMIIRSPLFDDPTFDPAPKDYTTYIERTLK